jgi:hypothetical protein
MGKLSPNNLRTLIEKPARYGDGDGLFFRTLGLGRSYFVYRYRFAGREREMSLGPYPELSLAEARMKHMALRKAVIVDRIDPLAERWSEQTNPAKQRWQIVERHRNQRKRLIRDEAPGLTHLYRHYGFDGQLLYVGVSNNTLDRWTGHKRAATWTDLIAVITIDHYPTRDEAEKAEAEAILSEKPRFNSHVQLDSPELRVLRRSRRKVWPKPETVAEPAP